MKHIFRVLTLVLSCFMVLSSVPMVSTAEETSETYAYGDILSSDEYIESLEEFDPNDYSTGNVRSSALPEDFDISTNSSTAPYFPAIGDQGNVGACTSFASVYYQFTYETNKLTNTVTTPDNTFCPFYIYGIVGMRHDEGSSLERNYDALSKLGCIKYSDILNSDISYLYDRAYYWPDNDEARLEALKIRAEAQSIIVDCTAEEIDGSITEADQVVTFDGSLTDYSLDYVKRALSLGKVLTVSVLHDSIKKQNDDFDYVITQSLGTGHHAMAIVGYDDNFEVDANEDNIISDWERGAFKVANSWGTTAQNHNDGYIWVMYDALNKVSACPDASYNHADRTSFLRTNGTERKYYTFFCLNAVQKDVYLAGRVSYNTQNKYKFEIYSGKSIANGGFSSAELERFPSDSYKFHEDGTWAFPFNGSIIVDLTDYDLSFGEYMTGYDYYFSFLSNNALSVDVINSCSIIDDLGETVLDIDTVSVEQIIMSHTHGSLDLQSGDVNYDGSLTDDDYQFFRNIMSGSALPISNVRAYLSDINGDGNINSRDSIALKGLINNN